MSTTTKVSPYLSALPPPPIENLTSHFTLGEIIDHLPVLQADYPHVKIPLLRQHLWRIRNNDVQHEDHLRGFLQVFEHTEVYQKALLELDEGMRRQLKVFMHGGTGEAILCAGREEGGFSLPPSPPVKRHFEHLAERMEGFFEGKDGVVEETNGHGGVYTEHLNEHVETKSMSESSVEGDGHANGVNGHVEAASTSVQQVKGHADEPQSDSKQAEYDVKDVNGHTKGVEVDGHVEQLDGPVEELPSLGDINGLTKHTDSLVKEASMHAEVSNGHANGLVDPVKPLSQAAPKQSSPRIFEDEAEIKTMEVYGDKKFENWGQSVSNTPLWTFVPKTVLGLQNLVKWAKRDNKRVRCSGYRHSWSETFSQDDQILVSLLNLESVNKLPDPMSLEPMWIDPENELKTIQLAAPPGVAASSADKALVRVGAAVTNEQFRRWAVANDKWTLPVDVILVEVTFGGVNGPICHGAGRAHGTVNDYVRAVEYVDANGEHRTVSDPEHLKAAAGCFGLLGVVTHLTFELDKMKYAVMQPIKPDIGLAIPPMSRDDIPIALRKTFTQSQYDEALADFEDRAENHYYAEWFWFTRSQQAWVNTWNPITSKADVQDYPSPLMTWFQWVENWLGSVIANNPIFQAMPGRWQAEILATFGMVALPPTQFSPVSFDQKEKAAEKIVTALPNALHFRRGIQNMRVRDLEFQIPIPGLKDDPSKPDWSIVRRAWWDIINLCYASDDCPMRLTMELRIMGSSSLHMAPQNGNTHGTASIEVLSIPDAVTDDEWLPFLQQVADKWLSYEDGNGKELNVRPHWAKEWDQVTMKGLPARQFLKEQAYKDQIPKFRETLSAIGESQGWGLGDLKERFSNVLWDYMVFE